ncbi:uncharacterized protein VP01_1369g6 [Puccinia sorghi]|uniref:Uncharacterized protein n=1 Tax=Puccinia sorghi TaxID=27349 RepID=A0A0L6VLX3_9BASI|nr:uncharacterized protein VP01_1369g6 [Puccinia sorghi]
MGQVKEDARRVLKMEARLHEEESRVLEDWEKQGVDSELVMEKNELKESIGSVYEQDHEWIRHAIAILPRLLAKSIHAFMLNQHLYKHVVEDEQQEDGGGVDRALGHLRPAQGIGGSGLRLDAELVYKEVLGVLAEAISTMNWRLGVLVLAE